MCSFPSLPRGRRPTAPTLRPAWSRGRQIQPVEKELERAVRLRALQNLRAEQERGAFADGGLHGRRTAVEILLAPRPAAPERGLAVIPRDALDAFARGVRREIEHWIA